MKILFFLHHSGYLRHYGEPVRLLAERGHDVTVAVGTWEKDPGDLKLVERLRGQAPGVEFALAPERRRGDGWRPVTWMARALADLSRYADPRYADADGLRDRIRDKLLQHVANGWTDPVTRVAAARLVRHLAAARDARTADRWGRILALVEDAIPTSRRVDRFVREQRPDLVLASPVVEFASRQVDYLKSGRRAGAVTGVCVASWDNLTNKGRMRFVPEGVLVWNEVQRGEAAELHGIPPERVAVTGAQRFDWWFEWSPTGSREEFARRVGLDPSQPYLLYVCSSPFIAPDEVGFVEAWLRALRASGDPRLRWMGALVRPHPQNVAQWREVDLSGHGNVAVWPRGGAQPDERSSRSDYYDSLAHCASVVGLNTSALIEAGILGKSVFTVTPPAFARTQDGTLHFHYLLRENGGFVHRDESLEAHLASLGALVDGTIDDEERLRSFVSSFVRPNGLDRRAADCVADAIEYLGRTAVAAAPPRDARTLTLRAALTALAGVATFTTFVGRAVRGIGRTARGGSPLARTPLAPGDEPVR